MQPANGIDVIKLEVAPSPPVAGSEVCVIVTTGLSPSRVRLSVVSGGQTLFDGPLPQDGEFCFQPPASDSGKPLVMAASSTSGSNPAANAIKLDFLR